MTETLSLNDYPQEHPTYILGTEAIEACFGKDNDYAYLDFGNLQALVFKVVELYEKRRAQSSPDRLLDPDMPAQELRLHMGELTAQEERTARAAIGWANTKRCEIRDAEPELSPVKSDSASSLRSAGESLGLPGGGHSPAQLSPVKATEPQVTKSAENVSCDHIGEVNKMVEDEQPVGLCEIIKIRIQQHKEKHMLETQGEKGISFGVVDRLTQQWEQEAEELTAELMEEIQQRTPEREAQQPVQLPYQQFFLTLWEEYCDGNLEIAEHVYEAAIKFGLAKEEEYDPDIHGERLGSEWGLEKGDICYVLAKPPEREEQPPVECADCKKYEQQLQAALTRASEAEAELLKLRISTKRELSDDDKEAARAIIQDCILSTVTESRDCLHSLLEQFVITRRGRDD